MKFLHNKANRFDLFVLSALTVLIVWNPLYLHGEINIYELGLYIPGINSVLHGGIPYRDFFYLRGPLGIYVQAFCLGGGGQATTSGSGGAGGDSTFSTVTGGGGQSGHGGAPNGDGGDGSGGDTNISGSNGGITTADSVSRAAWLAPFGKPSALAPLMFPGDGGYSNGSNSSGGGGGFAVAYLVASSLGATESVTVGAGGTGNGSGTDGRAGLVVVVEYTEV